MKTARNIGILALIALVLVVAPGGGPALEVMLTLLTIAFFASIAFLLRYVARHSLGAFVAYRIVLGVMVLALAASGAIS